MAVRLDHNFAWSELPLVCSRTNDLPVQIVIRFPAVIAEGKHPFPSRTRPLSPPAPMVLHGRRVGEQAAAGSIRKQGPARQLTAAGPYAVRSGLWRRGTPRYGPD